MPYVSTKAQARSEAVDLRMRRMRFELSDDLPLHWFRGSPYLTHFFNAMSAVFPEGEKFFIDSVRHFEPQITDPVLARQVAEFARQEGHHTHQHRLLNQLVEQQGFPLSPYDQALAQAFAFIRGRFTPLSCLGITAAIEHFTALLGDRLLCDPRTLEGVDRRVAPLWRWHAVEETEHKAVAFDVFLAMGGTYAQRARLLAKVTPLFASVLHRIHMDLLRLDATPASRSDRARGLYYLWGSPGLLRGIVPGYLRYYAPGFHPWDHDNAALSEGWVARDARFVVG
jgi:predicted metal-dependent hydrolase